MTTLTLICAWLRIISDSTPVTWGSSIVTNILCNHGKRIGSKKVIVENKFYLCKWFSILLQGDFALERGLSALLNVSYFALKINGIVKEKENYIRILLLTSKVCKKYINRFLKIKYILLSCITLIIMHKYIWIYWLFIRSFYLE